MTSTRRAYPRMRVPSAAGVVAGIAVVVAIALLFAAWDALPVFIIGLLVAYVLDPLVTWLAGRRVPRGLATLFAMLLAAAIVGAIAVLFVDTIATQAAAFIAGLPAAFAQLETWVRSLGLPAGIEADVLGFLGSVEATAQGFDITALFEPLLEGLFAILGSFFTLLTLPFFLFFVLAGRPTLARQVRDVLPGPWRDDILTVLGISLSSFGTYIRAEAIVAAILGVMVFVGITILGLTVHPGFLEFALLLAVIAAFSELIPNYGPWIAAIPAVAISLTLSPEAVVATILLYLVVMFVEGQVLVPKIEGGAFSFHPALVLFLVVAGVALMGILGAILALPVTAAAWRSARYVFRRATGLARDEALAWAGDEGRASVVAAHEQATGEPASETMDEAAGADEPGATAADGTGREATA